MDEFTPAPIGTVPLLMETIAFPGFIVRVSLKFRDQLMFPMGELTFVAVAALSISLEPLATHFGLVLGFVDFGLGLRVCVGGAAGVEAMAVDGVELRRGAD